MYHVFVTKEDFSTNICNTSLSPFNSLFRTVTPNKITGLKLSGNWLIRITWGTARQI